MADQPMESGEVDPERLSDPELMRGLTNTEQALVRTVRRIAREAAERERSLNAELQELRGTVSDLAERVETLNDRHADLLKRYETLIAAWNEELRR